MVVVCVTVCVCACVSVCVHGLSSLLVQSLFVWTQQATVTVVCDVVILLFLLRLVVVVVVFLVVVVGSLEAFEASEDSRGNFQDKQSLYILSDSIKNSILRFFRIKFTTRYFLFSHHFPPTSIFSSSQVVEVISSWSLWAPSLCSDASVFFYCSTKLQCFCWYLNNQQTNVSSEEKRDWM